MYPFAGQVECKQVAQINAVKKLTQGELGGRLHFSVSRSDVHLYRLRLIQYEVRCD